MITKNRAPMRLQPNSGDRNFPTQMQPAMPRLGKQPPDLGSFKMTKPIAAKPADKTDAARAAKAKQLRLISLRKQREATRP